MPQASVLQRPLQGDAAASVMAGTASANAAVPVKMAVNRNMLTPCQPRAATGRHAASLPGLSREASRGRGVVPRTSLPHPGKRPRPRRVANRSAPRVAVTTLARIRGYRRPRTAREPAPTSPCSPAAYEERVRAFEPTPTPILEGRVTWDRRVPRLMRASCRGRVRRGNLWQPRHGLVVEPLQDGFLLRSARTSPCTPCTVPSTRRSGSPI